MTTEELTNIQCLLDSGANRSCQDTGATIKQWIDDGIDPEACVDLLKEIANVLSFGDDPNRDDDLKARIEACGIGGY